MKTFYGGRLDFVQTENTKNGSLFLHLISPEKSTISSLAIILDGWGKYQNPPAEKDFVFNELYLDWNKDITIVEGVFDAIVARNAIPLLGSTLRESSYIFQKIVEKCDKVYLALDSDAIEKEDRIIRLLLSYGVDCYRVDTSGVGDVGEMDKETFQARKKVSAFVSLDNYLLEKLSF